MSEQKRYEELLALAIEYARSGEKEQLQKMLEYRLPLNLQDYKGNTLLMLAVYNDHLETAKMLLEFGADVDKRNDRGQTPLGGAAFKGYCNMIELLLGYGAHIDADQGGGKTPLFFAALFGRKDAYQLLIDRGANKRYQISWPIPWYNRRLYPCGHQSCQIMRFLTCKH
ncbi:ankyrin repeat domain-containing protein [Nitratiruptor sp. YY09-18]|uniref:ankyrin repeat domain-containing protein n=1 Tax=Nitratiruptor sp. YY09-18 TaxID=2724901 RepID=UPI001915C8A6|nr:ankyrin repeat domain-containing protein [Nitratiruptor sp. YY09-18]BCD67847.1 hypothetical protein NitYY0918_C0754 [Nitratiruptor sp. YY09-18]